MIPVRTLRFAAGIEALSLAALLGNLLSTHTPAISQLLGPLHGTAYLVVIAATSMIPPTLSSGARGRALIPGFGGLLALRQIRNCARASRPHTH
ncbi:hypothetical protein ACFT7S_07130 [Streptomyces sp. NPDC057136]|uniref:hypothetical protein n=1 Tax=Streptomyces sp. NPDC057136 TaxID=3346029 RepID=UPI003636426B